MAKMTESDLNAILDGHMANSLGGDGSKLASDRAKMLAYYYGKAEGDLAPPAIEGRSAIVATEVADTIEWLMPTLMRIFTGGDSAVEFAPQRQEDEESARQATEYINYVFYRQNPGFLVLHTWFKDALLQKYGVVKTWWDRHKEDVREEYRGMAPEELAYLLQESPELSVIEQKPNEDNPQLIDVACKRSKDVEQAKVEPIPPEDFGVNRRARSLDTADCLWHRVPRSLSDLRAAGYPKAKLDNLGDDENAGWTIEASERAKYDDETGGFFTDDAMGADESQRKIWLYEFYVRTDYDGDGIAEWRQVMRAGKEILRNTKVDGHPFSGLTPILMPHRLIGRSVAELVMDLQRIKTALLRQTLDNMYLVNNGRFYVDMNQKVNLDDLLNNRPGGIVRGQGQNGVSSLAPPMLGGGAFNLIEYVDTIRENRVGVTKYNQGLDANSLNKTATGITQIMSAAQQRIELLARVFAETGVKDMFLKLLKLATTHQSKAQIIRLTNGYVPIDPREWKTQFDVTVNVGLGTGNKDQQAAHLTNILQLQQGLVPAGIVSPRNLYETARRLPEALGFKSDAFFTDPAEAQKNAPPPSPDPNMLKMQSDQEQAQRDHEYRMAQLAQKDKELEVELLKARMDMQQKAESAHEDRELRKTELALKYPPAPPVVMLPDAVMPEHEPALPEMGEAMPDEFMQSAVSDDFLQSDSQGSEEMSDD